MALLGKPKQPLRRPPLVRRDATLGDRLVLDVHMAAHRDDRAGIRSAFDAASGWNQRAFLLDDLADAPETLGMAERWTSDEPDDPLGVLVHGAASVRSARTDSGSLAIAERHIHRAIGLDGDSPLPWYQLLISGARSDVGERELRYRFDEATSRAPQLYPAFDSMVEALGSCSTDDSVVWGFVEEFVVPTPVGSPLHAMVVAAHLQLAGEQDLIRYFGQPRVIIDVGDAAERSIWSPEFVDDRRDTAGARARNLFLLGHILNRDVASADRQLPLIGNRVSKRPWNHWGDEDPAQIMTDVYAKLDVVRHRSDPRRENPRRSGRRGR